MRLNIFILFLYFIACTKRNVIGRFSDNLIHFINPSSTKVLLSNEVKTTEEYQKYCADISSGKVNAILLRNCLIDPFFMLAITSSILSNSTRLDILSIRNCNLNIDSISRALSISNYQNMKSNEYSSNLNVLDLSFNNFNSRCIRYISTFISHSPKLMEIALDGNKLLAEDIRSLAYSLRRHPSPSILLSLSSCELNDISMEYITYCLKSNVNITQIDLSSNKITSEGIEFLFHSIRSGALKHLTSLDFSYNSIGDAGIINLAKVIEANQLPLLKNLIIKDVGATSLSIQKLLKSIQQGSALETLDISGNEFLIPNRPKKKKSSYGYNSKKVLAHFSNSVAMNDAIKTVSSVFINWKREKSQSTKSIHPTRHNRISNHGKRNSPQNVPSIEKKEAEKIVKKSLRSLISVISLASKLNNLGLSKVGLTDDSSEKFSKIVSVHYRKYSDTNFDACSYLETDLSMNNLTEAAIVTFNTAFKKVKRGETKNEIE